MNTVTRRIKSSTLLVVFLVLNHLACYAITNSNDPTFTIKEYKKADCHGNNGILQIEITDGLAPYSLEKLDHASGTTQHGGTSDTKFSIGNCNSGDHTITIKTADGGSTSKTIRLYSSLLDFSLTPNDSDCNDITIEFSFADFSFIPGTISVYKINTDNTRTMIMQSELRQSAIASKTLTADNKYVIIAERTTCRVEQQFHTPKCSPIPTNIPTEAVSEKSCKIYPNPTKGMVFFSNKQNELTNIEIFDLSGRKVYQTQTSDNHLNLKQLKSGIYQIILTTNSDVVKTKLIKK